MWGKETGRERRDKLMAFLFVKWLLIHGYRIIDPYGTPVEFDVRKSLGLDLEQDQGGRVETECTECGSD